MPDRPITVAEFLSANRPIYLLMAYAKARKEDLTPEEKRTVRAITAILKGQRK